MFHDTLLARIHDLFCTYLILVPIQALIDFYAAPPAPGLYEVPENESDLYD